MVNFMVIFAILFVVIVFVVVIALASRKEIIEYEHFIDNDESDINKKQQEN